MKMGSAIAILNPCLLIVVISCIYTINIVLFAKIVTKAAYQKDNNIITCQANIMMKLQLYPCGREKYKLLHYRKVQRDAK